MNRKRNMQNHTYNIPLYLNPKENQYRKTKGVEERLKHALSLPALIKVHPSSDTATEVTVDWCFSSVAKHFLLVRSQTRTVESSLPVKSYEEYRSNNLISKI